MQQVVTVARDGQRCANVRRGGVRLSFPVWIIAVYEARPRKRDGVVTWRRVESYGPSVACARGPSSALVERAVAFALDTGLPFAACVRHGDVVQEEVS